MKKLLAIIVTVLGMAMLFTGCAGAAKNAQLSPDSILSAAWKIAILFRIFCKNSSR